MSENTAPLHPDHQLTEAGRRWQTAIMFQHPEEATEALVAALREASAYLPPALAAALLHGAEVDPGQADSQFHLTVVVHRHGEDVALHSTLEDAEESLNEFVRTYWETEVDTDTDGPCPEVITAEVRAFYADKAGETLSIESMSPPRRESVPVIPTHLL